MDKPSPQNKNNKMVLKLLIVVVGMFGFGFALVPLYDVLCDALGINGKPSDTAAVYEAVEIDESRLVTVDFITRINTGMPWEFRTETKRVKVHPGQLNKVDFYVRNPAKTAIVGQAVPSVSPGPAAIYMNKTECFCFESQTLAAGERVELPVRFIVDPALPEEIGSLSLGYTLFDITDQIKASQALANL